MLLIVCDHPASSSSSNARYNSLRDGKNGWLGASLLRNRARSGTPGRLPRSPLVSLDLIIVSSSAGMSCRSGSSCSNASLAAPALSISSCTCASIASQARCPVKRSPHVQHGARHSKRVHTMLQWRSTDSWLAGVHRTIFKKREAWP